MSPLMIIGLVFGIVVVVAAALLAVLLKVRQLANRANAAMRAELGETPVLLEERAANCFGVESQGMAQVRGNGVLVLTAEDLRFRMWAPARGFVVSRRSIQHVETARSHLGKSKGRDLLKLSFVNDAGQSDSVAWLLRDLAPWLTQLRSTAP